VGRVRNVLCSMGGRAHSHDLLVVELLLPGPAVHQTNPRTISISHTAAGAAATMMPPQTRSWRKKRSRSTPWALASTSAPVVEKGLPSTTVADTASAETIAIGLTVPSSRNGTASGMRAPMMPTDEANADTIAPM